MMTPDDLAETQRQLAEVSAMLDELARMTSLRDMLIENAERAERRSPNPNMPQRYYCVCEVTTYPARYERRPAFRRLFDLNVGIFDLMASEIERLAEALKASIRAKGVEPEARRAIEEASE